MSSREQPHPAALPHLLLPLLKRLRDAVLVRDPEPTVLRDEFYLVEQDVPLLLVVVSQQYSGNKGVTMLLKNDILFRNLLF